MTETLAPVAPNPLTRYLHVLVEPRTYAAIVWLFAALPLGVAAFTYGSIVSALGLGLLVTIAGLPLLVAFLFSVRALAAVEGRLAAWALGASIEPAAFRPQGDRPGLIAATGAMLRDGLTWTGLLYMALRLPLGIAGFVVACVALAIPLGLMAAPFTYDGAHVQLFSVRADTLGAAWGCAIVGALLLPASLHVVRGAAWCWGQVARVLLRASAKQEPVTP